MGVVLTPSVARVVNQGRVARLATADRGGQPLVVPISYASNGRHCYSVVDLKPKQVDGARLKRIRNIQENPKVSLLIDHYEEDWSRLSYVIIQSRAELLSEGDEFRDAVELLLAKYPQYRAMALDRERGIMIKMTPERVIEWRATPAEHA